MLDMHNPSKIQSYIHSAKFNWGGKLGAKQPFGDSFPPSFLTENRFVDIEILAVIGDTMLYSIACIYGYSISGFDLYDSCLVFVKVNNQTFLVPASRVLSGNISYVKAHPEDGEPGTSPQFIPKMGPCRAEDNGWVFWIPLGSGRWLYMICGFNFLGKQRVEVLDNAEVTRRLMLGTLWVSITTCEEIEDFVEKSAVVGHILLFYFLGEEENTRLPELETFGKDS
jgi:hypothetical protein